MDESLSFVLRDRKSIIENKSILTFTQSESEVSDWIKWKTNQQADFANSFSEGLSRNKLVQFLVSQNTIAATHAALELSPMNKEALGMLSEKYGELAAEEKGKIMKEYYTDKSRWYSKASE